MGPCALRMGPCAEEGPDIETCSLCTERGPCSQESPTISVFRAFGEGPSLRVGPCAEKGSDTDNVFYIEIGPLVRRGFDTGRGEPLARITFLMTKDNLKKRYFRMRFCLFLLRRQGPSPLRQVAASHTTFEVFAVWRYAPNYGN